MVFFILYGNLSLSENFCWIIAELLGALRGRLYDSNKNLVMAALTTVGGVASAMGPPIEKQSKVCKPIIVLVYPLYVGVLENLANLNCFKQGILSDVLKCLGDKNKHMRECTIAALDSWVAAVHLDKMVISSFPIILWVFYVDSCLLISLLIGSLHHDGLH